MNCRVFTEAPTIPRFSRKLLGQLNDARKRFGVPDDPDPNFRRRRRTLSTPCETIRSPSPVILQRAPSDGVAA